MKVSLNWLNEHLDLSGRTSAQLDELLTFSGIEVEGIEERGGNIDKIVVAQVLASDPHPDAEKLSICKVDDGSGEPLQIVCGAKNYKVGDKVPLAQIGARMPSGLEIKKGKLRGVDSHGMLCSATEIGFSSEVDGLMILPPDALLGAPISSLFKPDTIFDLEITPNRPDCLSHLGIARELSVLTEQSLKGDVSHSSANVKIQTAKDDEVKISDTAACPVYSARHIRHVKVGPSPEWLREKLESIGLRPINNIVDITNFVLMEMGQPLHAFDTAKLKGGIHVRPAAEGEKFLALDGVEYVLKSEDLLIADASGGVAIGGVMGGELSGVTESTTDVLLESAWFEPSGIRRTSRRLNLSSDSSYRFERGVDPQQVLGASELATKLILEIAGGEADDVTLVCGEAPVMTGTVILDHQKCADLLGIDLGMETNERILTGLGIQKLSASETSSDWAVPSWRADLQRHVDLVEEIARVYGLDNIPSSYGALFAEINDVDREYDFVSSIGQKLASLGFHEARTIKLISEGQLNDHLCPLFPAESVPLKNPLSDDHTHMRPGIIPGLLAVAERNIRMGATSLRFFETGTVFNRTRDGKVLEKPQIGILLSGQAHPASWHDKAPADAAIYDLRGILEAIAPGLRLEPVTNAGELALSADLKIGKMKVGRAGQIQPERARKLDATGAVIVAEIDLVKLRSALTGEKTQFTEMPKFPAVTRDIAMEVPRELLNAEVENFFAGLQVPLLQGFSLFDVFADDSGVKLDRTKKSLAYSLTYRHESKTLESSEVDTAHAEILATLQKKLPAKLR